MNNHFLGPVPYSSDKAVPWNYGPDVYYHGVKQDWNTEEADPNISNIVGTSKVTRSGRFSLPRSPRRLLLRLLLFHLLFLLVLMLLLPFLLQLLPLPMSYLGIGEKNLYVSLPGRRNLEKLLWNPLSKKWKKF